VGPRLPGRLLLVLTVGLAAGNGGRGARHCTQPVFGDPAWRVTIARAQPHYNEAHVENTRRHLVR